MKVKVKQVCAKELGAVKDERRDLDCETREAKGLDVVAHIWGH
jgi:hypothetical protein